MDTALTPDQDQQRIINLDGGVFQVTAGAGSGKSFCLMNRTARLSQEKGGRLLCVTFSNEAAKNLRTRCGKLFPSVDTSSFSTIHSLALKFAVTHNDSFPFALSDNPLVDEGVAAKAVFAATENKINYNAFKSWVSLQKRKRISPIAAIYEAEKTGVKLDYALSFKRYQQILKKIGVLDFDDLIYFMVEILETRPDIGQQWQYQWVMQDEAQDACELDWRLLQLLTGKYKNLLCVGDPSQALYSFRGGVAEHFLNMNKYFPGTETHYLSYNYRSTKNIVEFGKTANPFPEISKRFVAVREEQGTQPTVTGFSTDYREAEYVVQEVKKYDPDACAILARTNLALRVFEEKLIDEGIRYYSRNDSDYWQSPEIQHILHYLRCVNMLTNNSILGALRSPYWPSRFIKKKLAAEQIKQLIETKRISAWKALDHVTGTRDFKTFLRDQINLQYLPAGEAVVKLVKNLKVLEYHAEEANINPDRNPIDNIKELVKVASRRGSILEFLEWVRKIQGYNRNRKGVCLSTIHSVKGCEFKNVFVVNVSRGMLPHSKSEDMDGEKCCWFVSCSRAMDRLFVSYNGTPSEFLTPFLQKNETFIEKEGLYT